MEKTELIKNYRKAEKEIEVAEKAFAELENKSTRSQEALSQAKEKLTFSEQAQGSPNLTSLKEIEDARNLAQKAKTNHDDLEVVLENLELAVQNSASAINKLKVELSQQKHLISIKLLDEKAQEIEKAAGYLFEEYSAIILGTNRSCPFDLHAVPDNLKFITARGVDLRGIQADIFAKL